jgi:hypothetical protein
MAWVMLAWKRPPWGECIERWVGRTWPAVKKVARSLFWKQMSWAPRPQRRFEGFHMFFMGSTPQMRGSSRLLSVVRPGGDSCVTDEEYLHRDVVANCIQWVS